MIGAIAGDIIGSVYEPAPIKTMAFLLFQPRSRFIDDSVLTSGCACRPTSGGWSKRSSTATDSLG